MDDYDPQPTKRSPAVWVALGCGVVLGIGLCCGGCFAWQMFSLFADASPVLPFIYSL